MFRSALVLAIFLVTASIASAQVSEPARLPAVSEQNQAPVQTPAQGGAIDPAASRPAEPIAPAPQPQPESPFEGLIYDRSKLTGDWFGLRDDLLDNGMTLDVSTTQFYQGVASGGINQTWEYGGRADYIFNMNGEKAGLWKGFLFNLHGETRYGNTINNATGALVPANTSLLFPATSGGVTALTAVKGTQFLSENLLVFGGKLNLLDELVQPYSGGRGVDAFMNTALVLPMSLARTVPYSTLGAGFVMLDEMHPVFTFMVFDTHNTPLTSGFESLFTNGVSMLTKLETPVELFGLPGHQAVGGSYSTGSYNDLTPTAYLNPNVGAVVSFGSTAGSWSVYYSADQALYVDPNNPKRSWGLFTNIGLADNGPSPIRWSAAVGFGGSSPIESRPRDTFGIGYAFTDYTDPVKDLAHKLLPVQADQAVELFYNIAVTPWFRLTPDLQVLIPGRERKLLPPGPIDTAVVVGVRAKIDF